MQTVLNLEKRLRKWFLAATGLNFEKPFDSHQRVKDRARDDRIDRKCVRNVIINHLHLFFDVNYRIVEGVETRFPTTFGRCFQLFDRLPNQIVVIHG